MLIENVRYRSDPASENEGRNALTLLSQNVIRIVAAVISTGTVILRARGSMWGDKLQALVLTLVSTENPISTTVVSIHKGRHHSRRSNSMIRNEALNTRKSEPIRNYAPNQPVRSVR